MTGEPFARIRESLDENLFVEAGAGTGKTRALVDRVAGLVAAGVPLPAIVAITFTEKAAAELRERVRGELESRRASEPPGGPFASALEALDAAPISTIHAFASDIVRAFAAEAGVDPDFQVIDEIAAERRFQQRWRDHLEQLGDDPAHREAFARVLRLGMWPGDIERLARALWPRPDIAQLVAGMGPGPSATWPDLVAWAAQLATLPLHDKPPGDELAARLGVLQDLVTLLIPASEAEREALLAGAGVDGMKLNKSNLRVWPDKKVVVALGEEIRDSLTEVLEALREHALRGILPAIATFVIADAARRRREGTLTFDDLIGIARELMTTDERVRRAVRERYRAMLIDEFQDTDSWQFAIAHAFATDPGTGALEPGRLFLVGDPKQSIYRFRGADMEIYEDAKATVTGGFDTVELAESRRSVPGIITWVNRVFSVVFAGRDEQFSPAYTPMEAVRTDAPAGPAVAAIGGVTEGKVADARKAEAAHVAATCLRLIAEGWEVVDRRTGALRPAACRDIAILIPARTVLPDIEQALETAGIPARVESGSLVFQTQEIRDLINILTAVDDPADGVAVVAALRSPAFACSDVELAAHRLDGGTFNYLNPGNPPGPVTDAMARLRTLHEQRSATPLAVLVQAVLTETGIVASAIYDRADRDAFRRARFVIEQARSFETDGPQPLRAFVDWLEERSATPLVEHEGTALDDDEDAVRILTVHGAKGLEFPAVIMAGFGTNPRPPSRPHFAIERETGAIAVHAGGEGRRFTAGPLEAVWRREKDHAAAEHLRVLYVAATRARDHLVVSLYRSPRSERSGAAILEAAGAAEGVTHLSMRTAPTAQRVQGRLAGIAVHLPPGLDREEVAANRRRLVDGARKLRVTSATALKALRSQEGRWPDGSALAGEVKDDRDDDTEPWSHGRGGTRFGRAVHAVIQSAPLGAEPDVIEAFAQAQAVAEAIPGRADEVAELAARALASATLQRAQDARRVLREVPFAVEIEGAIVEGFVDLLLEHDGGLEIVDWKTDHIASAAIAQRIAEYRLQAGLYVLALERATGMPVRRVTYVFLTAGIERDFDDPPALAREAAAMLSASATR